MLTDEQPQLVKGSTEQGAACLQRLVISKVRSRLQRRGEHASLGGATATLPLLRG